MCSALLSSIMSVFCPFFRRAWWRTNVRIQVKRPSRSSTSSSPALVQRVTASMPPDSPACQRRSSSQDTGRPESLRRAPSASGSSSMYKYWGYILYLLHLSDIQSKDLKGWFWFLSPLFSLAGSSASLLKMLHWAAHTLLHSFRCSTPCSLWTCFVLAGVLFSALGKNTTVMI